MNQKINKEEFLRNWLLELSNKKFCPDREYFERHFVILPCECPENCEGWIVLFNHPLIIENHNRTSNPETRIHY